MRDNCSPWQAWAALDKHYQVIKDVHMRSLFDRDAARFDQFSMQVGDILLDYSKNRTTAETMQLLTALAADAGVCEKRDAMFRGLHTCPRKEIAEEIAIERDSHDRGQFCILLKV